MRLIDSEPLVKFITDGLNSGKFGNDAVEILTEIEYAPTVDAVTLEELQAAIIDMNTLCRGNICSKCDYDKARVCGIGDSEDVDAKQFILVYRRRKEMGLC